MCHLLTRQQQNKLLEKSSGGSMNVAIIPARGGSKRIPRKNIREFHGKPMIAWSIEAAKRSECFDKIIVSTDDAEIAHIARQYGAEVPFTRPDYLADDFSTTSDVVKHAIQYLQPVSEECMYVCCIYATAPFVTAESINEGLNRIVENECDYVFPVTTFAYPIQRAIKITPDNRIEMFCPEHLKTRSQDLEEAWHDAGQFYWGRIDAWLQEVPLFGTSSCPLILPRHYVQDIDTEEDWIRAESIFSMMMRNGGI